MMPWATSKRNVEGTEATSASPPDPLFILLVGLPGFEPGTS